MESINYSNLGNKLNKKTSGDTKKQQKLTLEEVCQRFLDTTVPYVEEKLIFISYAGEIESLLKLTNIEETITGLFALEKILNKLKDLAPADYEIPYFDEFWKSLSKTILLSLWESLENEDETDEIIKGWYESLRISLESELYSIQERWG